MNEKQTNLWLPESLIRDAKVYAARNGISMKKVFVLALEKFLEENQDA